MKGETAMDWNMVIEGNREALKRIVAMLVAMAGLGYLSSPLAGEDGSARRGEAEALAEPGEGVPTLPRHLHRAILRLLRPAESAVRRLIIVAARGLVVTLLPPRPSKPKPTSIFLTKPGGTGVYLPRGVRLPDHLGGSAKAKAARAPSLPLLDPLKSFQPRRPVQTSIPRISFPGYAPPSPIKLRRPPAPGDQLDATRITLRLAALGSALADLPGQARRFARWKARKEARRTTRNWPLRPGRAPGQLKVKSRRQEVHDVLSDLHWFAFEAMEKPDTS
jgi:hypothetical protein